MGIRVQVSKRTRFEVFKRDLFTCQYCGQHPPSVLLEVDHITPVVLDGTNAIDNLITACEGCNRGKAGISLDVIPESLKEKAARIQESEKQLLAYQKIIQAKTDRIERESWIVADVLDEGCTGFDRNKFRSIERFVERLGMPVCVEAMKNAISKQPRSQHRAFLYFCGTCWRIIRREENR